LAVCITDCLWSGFNFHFESIIEDHGLPPSTTNYLFLPVSFASTLAILGCGFLFDRIHVKSRGLMLATTSCTIAVGILLIMDSPLLVILFSLLLGSMDGVSAVGYSTVFAYNFGRVDVGTMNSATGAITTFWLGIAPFLFGLCHDYLNSYNPILFVIAIAAAIMSIILFMVGPPIPPVQEVTISELIEQKKNDN